MSSPPRSLSAHIPHSTPHSRGSSSNRNSASQTAQEDYAPFLKEDLSCSTTVSVDDFLDCILNSGHDIQAEKRHEFLAIIESTDVREALEKLRHATSTGSKEDRMYHPFAEFANLCLDKLTPSGKTSKTRLGRNDPVYVHGSDADRKPDVVQASAESMQLSGREGPDGLAPGGPKELPFHWGELYAFWEFKLKQGSRSTAAASTPAASGQAAAQEPAAAPSVGTRRSTRIQEQQDAAPPPGEPLVPNELPDADPPARPAKGSSAIQCANYALEMLSHSRLRRHAFGVLISHHDMELQYYDRSIIVKSETFDFTELDGMLTFLAVLSALENSYPKQWYPKLLSPTVPPVPSKPGALDNLYSQCRMTLSGPPRWELVLGKTLCNTHGIIGRGTVVVRATVAESPQGQHNARPVVVKWNWSPKSRRAEVDFIRDARVLAQQNEPRLLNHLPNIFHSCQMDEVAHDIAQRLGVPGGYEGRTLRIMVQEPLQPLYQSGTSALGADDLAKAFRDIFTCYRWLVEIAKILHRDISTNNLMFRRTANGEIQGVLIDFDLAKQMIPGAPISTSRQRTGTKPFMAIDLLVEKPPRHLPRHDLESFMYVLLFLVCDTRPGSHLAKWRNLGMEALKHAKENTLRNVFPPLKEGFNDFQLCIIGLQEMFSGALAARQLAQLKIANNQLLIQRGMVGSIKQTDMLDEETLGGTITFDTFSAWLLN